MPPGAAARRRAGHHGFDLGDGQQREPEQQPAHLTVVGLHEVLEELERRGALGIEPDAGARGLAELRAVAGREQRPAQGVHRVAGAPADQVHPRQDVAPLIRAADLQLATFVLVQPPVVVGL